MQSKSKAFYINVVLFPKESKINGLTYTIQQRDGNKASTAEVRGWITRCLRRSFSFTMMEEQNDHDGQPKRISDLKNNMGNFSCAL